MARIVLADDGIRFDGTTLRNQPLGGAESAFISLAEALAARGHAVTVYNNCERRLTCAGVKWVPLAEGLPDEADLYIANRGDRLLPLLPKARRRVFWIHNPAFYLLKLRYLWKLWRLKPAIVFSGAHHAATYPGWAPCGERAIIPYGIADTFRGAAEAEAIPKPVAIFTSNPLRSLDWLLEVWAERIFPRVPGAELRLFAGARTYGAAGEAKAGRMGAILDRAAALSHKGVILCEPIPKPALRAEILAARVMLYKGDIGETFCLAIGESQALGLPCVVQDIGCVAERVIDGETGFVANDDAAFAEAAIRLLTDDALWRRQHAAALAQQGRWGWAEAAVAFEKLLPEARP